MSPEKINTPEEVEVIAQNNILGDSTPTTIESLPVEILVMVFGHLAFTQHLIARLVCKSWYNSISSDLWKHSRFTVNSTRRHKTFPDAHVNWKLTTIELLGYNSIQKSVKNLISDLRLTLPDTEFNLRKCMEFLLTFPNVKHLTLRISDSKKPSKNNKRASASEELNSRFGEFVQRLESLEIICKFRDYFILIQLLDQISSHELKLESLVLKEMVSTAWSLSEISDLLLMNIDQDSMSARSVCSLLHKVIVSSSKTLKNLDLLFYSYEVGRALSPEIISKLCDINDLDLDAVLLRYIPWTDNIGQDFVICQKFLATQKNLKKFLLPEFPDANHCKSIVTALSSTVHSLQEVTLSHVSPEFPQHLQSLQNLTMVIESPMGEDDKLFHNVCLSVRNISIQRKKNEDAQDFTTCSLFKNLADCFPSVTSLILSEINHDSDLQKIIQHFQGLQILEIMNCEQITDFGVSGIDQNYCEELLSNRAIHNGSDFSIAPGKCIGHSICSLRKLKKLVFGPGSSISDVGIYFGFRFGSTLTTLTVDFESSTKISDWGLYWLGKNNPCLEEFQGTFSSRGSTLVGRGILRNHLPLLESTRRFSLKCGPMEYNNKNF